jgi:hypothetical protein
VDRHQRWRDNWRVVSPPSAVLVDLGRSRTARAFARERVAGLRAGSPVVLVSSAPGASRRCRSFASEAGIRLDREYLAFPSAAMPGYLVEDDIAPVRAFTRSVLVAPPRARLSFALEAGVTIVRALGSRRVMSALAPGRVVVGWRS